MFIAQHHLGNTRRDDADAILAGIVALDDRDIGVPHVVLEPGTKIFQPLATLFDQGSNRNAGDARRRPEEYLRGAVLADHLRVNVSRVHAKMPSEMDTEAQAVEERPRAQDAIMARDRAS